MKTNFLHVPVSSWKDELTAPVYPSAGPYAPADKFPGKFEDYYLLPAGKSLTVSRRLVVLVPTAAFDERELALKVGRLAQWGRKEILLVGLAGDPQGDSLLRRRMATVIAYLRGPRIEAHQSVIYHDNWLTALRDRLVEGDRLICLEDHFTPGRFLGNQRLAQRIASDLDVPVYVVRGIRLEVEEERRWAGVRNLLVWASVLLTLVFFLLFQIHIQQAVAGALGMVIEIFSVVIEVAVIMRISMLG